MKKTKKKEEEILSKRLVSLSDLRIGDIIYIEKMDENSEEYQVLDVGDPFILILNLRTGFANLYKGTIFYK